MDTIQDVLIYQTQMMRNSSLGPYVQPDFSPPEYIVVVNALFYASLGVMLLAAFVAMLIISWVHEFDHGLGAISIPEQRAKTREFRYLGMERWKLEEMVAMLPLLIQISLLIFAIGLVLFLFRISKPSFGVTTAIFGVGVLYYAITTTISVFVTSSPFHSPLSRALARVYQYVHAYFCPGLDVFLSPNMDITPGTGFGRFHRRLQIFLQKSRPYLERDFVKPITATTLDDVQLSTAASALQRIHDSVADSQHSELIQQPIWQVAGNPALRMRPLLKLPAWVLERGNDKEYFKRLSPASAVALAAVFVRMRDPRYKRRIAGVEDRCRAVGDSGGSWAQVVHAIFGLLPDDFDRDDYDNTRCHRAFRLDTLFREALPDALSVDTLRNNILQVSLRDSRLCLFLWSNFRMSRIWHTLRGNYLNTPLCDEWHIGLRDELCAALRDALRNTPLRVIHAFLHDAFFGNAPLDDMALQGRAMRVFDIPKRPSDLLNILRDKELHEEEVMWLLSTLSGLHCDGLVSMGDYVSRICLAVLLHQAPKWNQMTPPSIMLIEAVVTLVAVSCSSNETYQMKTLTNSHQYPWLLLNLRNIDLIRRMRDEIASRWREEVISILFLVIYALTLVGSERLAEQYLAIITAKADFASCASALSKIAPALGDDGFRAIGELLLSPQTQFSTTKAGVSMSNNTSATPQVRQTHLDLFNNYDLHLGTSEFPDPKIAAILLLLSKNLGTTVRLDILNLKLVLRDPWLQIAANKILRHRISDEPTMDMPLFHDHRVCNMLGAFSLLHGSSITGTLTQPVFLGSSEPTICCAALRHFVASMPSHDLSGAVHVVFNPKLPNHHLSKGWDILNLFMGQFDQLSPGQRQAFATAFFTLSRRPLPRGTRKNNTSSNKQNLLEILTWDYFCKEEPEPELTDAEFSGLDWMVAAWLLHLSQQPNFKQDWVNDNFVLNVLCNLLYSAPYYSIIPIVPKLREFVGGFDDPQVSEHQSWISASIGEFYRQECKVLFKFQKFNCVWYT